VSWCIGWFDSIPHDLKEKTKMEKIEYYTLRPNLKQIYGKKVDETTEFIEKTEDGTVNQTFKDLTLTTMIKKTNIVGGYEIEEESKVTVKVPKGTILIWNEQEGFIIPQYQMTTLEELKKEIDEISNIYDDKVGDVDDTTGNEETNS
jgi:hypothetical protein